METLRIRYTRGDHATQPGGIILRVRTLGPADEVEYITHTFNRAPGSREPTEYFWGRYFTDDMVAALMAFHEKVDSAKQFTTGGSLIDDRGLDDELAKELKAVV